MVLGSSMIYHYVLCRSAATATDPHSGALGDPSARVFEVFLIVSQSKVKWVVETDYEVKWSSTLI